MCSLLKINCPLVREGVAIIFRRWFVFGEIKTVAESLSPFPCPDLA